LCLRLRAQGWELRYRPWCQGDDSTGGGHSRKTPTPPL
jgi:hypothetical protein